MKLQIFHGDALDVLETLPSNTFHSLLTDPPAGIGFMGSEWDSNKGDRDRWIVWLATILRETFRVMRPGAHGLVWSLPRTSHWTATAAENAGFEIRDRVSHFFGQGFPKGLDVSKAIDAHITKGASNSHALKATGKERPGKVSMRVIDSGGAGRMGGGVSFFRDETQEVGQEPITAEAAIWNGWSTALKPACEDWWLIRKPFKGAVARNVLEHGTGALNIDACRIQGEVPTTKQGASVAIYGNGNGFAPTSDQHFDPHSGGRWPAHITLDEEAARMLDKQSGELNSGARSAGVRKGLGFHGASGDGGPSIDPSSGGAARFFYCAKASRSEREAGLDNEKDARANTHPTVKPVALMRWLARLITPPGGLVLDPFAGSGSTGVACAHEDFSFVGIEREKEYADIARARIVFASNNRQT